MLRLPNNSSRTVLIGRTGTGKTVAGLWHLTNYPVDSTPWVLMNFKNDEHIESIEKAQFVELGYVPEKKESGLFVVDVRVTDTRGTLTKPSALTQYFNALWERKNVGIFIDEAWMVGDDDGFVQCLTQGRSLRIPMIICTQRPSWISRFAFSEASFIQCFDLNDSDDIRRVEGFMPLDWDSEPPLADHQSYYYEVARNNLLRLNPVPDMDAIRKTFNEKLTRKRVRI